MSWGLFVWLSNLLATPKKKAAIVTRIFPPCQHPKVRRFCKGDKHADRLRTPFERKKKASNVFFTNILPHAEFFRIATKTPVRPENIGKSSLRKENPPFLKKIRPSLRLYAIPVGSYGICKEEKVQGQRKKIFFNKKSLRLDPWFLHSLLKNLVFLFELKKTHPFHSFPVFVFSFFSLSFQSSFHLSFTLLVCYRSFSHILLYVNRTTRLVHNSQCTRLVKKQADVASSSAQCLARSYGALTLFGAAFQPTWRAKLKI